MSLGRLSAEYYTATEARKKLGLTEDAFQGWIKAKKIDKIAVPGRRQGVFLKREIDFIVAGIETALLMAKRPPRFEKATIENQSGEFALAVQNFGERAVQFNEIRREFLQKNPDMTYYLYDGNMVVAAINILPLSHEGIMKFREGERGWLLGEYIEQFKPGHQLQVIIIDMMTTTLAPANRRKQYGQHLLLHLIDVFTEWGRKGIEIAFIHACGSTPDGRQILEKARFTYLGEKRPGRHVYGLNIAQSDLPILLPYKQALAAWKRQ